MVGSMPWLKQAYLSLIPAFPIGYILVHGFRGEQFWTKLYVNRSNLPPTDSLLQVVECEMDSLTNISNPKKLVTLTNDFEPNLYGGFFLNPGAELQFPLRVAVDDVEQARRLGSSLELDLGLAKHRRKVEVNSPVGDELISRFMLSDNAKRFIVQRQLLLANNGTNFCVPMFAWIGISGAGYLLFAGMMPAVGGAVALAASAAVVILLYRQFISGFYAHMTKKADEAAVQLGEIYLRGARDYFTSAMNFNRLLRKVLGEEGEKNILKNGDFKSDIVPYSERLKLVEEVIKKEDRETEW